MQFDVLVVGAGIAGASAAALLARRRRVLLLERESHPGYHSTGRSAAVYAENYGPAPVGALTRASRSFLYAPPAGFSEASLLTPRGLLTIATEAQWERLDAKARRLAGQPGVRQLSPTQTCALCPLLRSEYVASALYEPDVADLDADALLQGYLRLLRTRHGRLVTNATVQTLEHARGVWSAQTDAGAFEAPLLVNAAGAWADEVAHMAGAHMIGLTPMRRTAVLVPMPASHKRAHLPMVVDCEEQFYFKTDAGQLLLSPADETPAPPHDVAADEWDVAVAVDRVTRATTLEVRTVTHRWAGLRTFAPDRLPALGFDKSAPNFFWLAGQGGVGLQTAPALAQAVVDLIENGALSADLVAHGVDAAMLDVGRYAASTATL